MTAQEHDNTRPTHNNRQDKKNQNTETKRGGGSGAQKVIKWDQGRAGGLSQGG